MKHTHYNKIKYVKIYIMSKKQTKNKRKTNEKTDKQTNKQTNKKQPDWFPVKPKLPSL